MKLTPKQQRVVDLMKQGYELGFSQGLWPRAWLQFGGVGRGGKAEDVHLSTFFALLKHKLIAIRKESYPTSTYKLEVSDGDTV